MALSSRRNVLLTAPACTHREVSFFSPNAISEPKRAAQSAHKAMWGCCSYTRSPAQTLTVPPALTTATPRSRQPRSLPAL